MNTKVIIAILLLLMAIAAIYASEDPTEQTEYLQKKQQLDLLAERFKAETGFKGDIETSFEHMKLSRFTGNFDDIDMTNIRDSVAFRQVCNTVISKLLPFIGAKSEQLVPVDSSIGLDCFAAIYKQMVNGYPVEKSTLKITYLPSSNQRRFSILNDTVEISQENLGKTISKEEAILIAHQQFFKNNDTIIKPGKVVLAYTNGRDNVNDKYYLCYSLYMGTVVCVDAVTGEIRYTWRQERVHTFTALVTGDVYSNSYADLNPTPMGYLPLRGVSVQTNSFSGSSDHTGVVSIEGNSLDGLSSILEECPYFSVTVYPDMFNAKYADRYLVGNTPIDIFYDDDPCYTPNIYYHANDQRCKLETMFGTSNYGLFGTIIVSGHNGYSAGGEFDPSNNRIYLSNSAGKLSHATRHEVSHCFVYDILQDYFNPYSTSPSQDLWAMDEAFAVYLPCAALDQPDCIYGNTNEITSITPSTNTLVTNISSTFYGNAIVTEPFYSKSYNRYPIASAWWDLRSNAIFGLPNPVTSMKAFDALLTDLLLHNVSNSFSDRYKPRYFYNLLMQRVADAWQTTGLNDKQRAIDAAYSSRGLHFNPKVESVSSSLKARNIFRLNEPVHVKVSNCPQNTRINVYVIKHNDYTYLDGALTSDLSNHYAHGFTPNTTAITNSSGEWSGLIWTTPSSAEDAVGEYDIIVDLGSPTTPDGIIHFTFSAANVMDGIDGRTKPGFKVTDSGIDVVMAEQASAETQHAEIHQ